MRECVFRLLLVRLSVLSTRWDLELSDGFHPKTPRRQRYVRAHPPAKAFVIGL